ncbi:glycosyltransferase [Patescibacteria group bacterium]|nr:MAG: glycosyltransferase [Patescibacteria group bacterium]
MSVKKICLITCYNQPDYIRARTLRATLRSMDDVDLIVVKNKHTNILRYIEVFWRVLVVRIKYHPDIYFQTFRAYESFPVLRLITIGKKFVFDEFINPIEQVAYENHYIKPGGIVAGLARLGYKFWLLTVSVIVTDTPSHAAYSAKLMKLPVDKYVPLIVSTDEVVFKKTNVPKKTEDGMFTIFYYGLFMMPLQGLDVILNAMKLLKDQDIDIKLVLIGGKDSTIDKVARVQDSGANIEYKKYVPYESLPDYMASADLCLAGPFGGTVQAQYVIGGKTFQYLHMGRPTIIGRNEESHIWTDKKDALIVDQANPRQLADAILWAKNHPSELRTIGQKGQQLYEHKLSNKELARELRLLLLSKRLA